MQASILDIPVDEIHEIKSCWEKLNAIHYNDSVYSKDYYSKFTFEKRLESIRLKITEKAKLTLVKVGDSVGGYCLSTSVSLSSN